MPHLLTPMEAALIEKVEAMEWNHRKDRAQWERQATKFQAEIQSLQTQVQEVTTILQSLAPLWGITAPRQP
ncbi:hypothetical protein GCM10010991_25250 [Gemmobacter aquaticus]|uniref:Uncharacterized protein n=1 Tax=Gemmobacter aquaticus TaxID=490185 RepID=A0A917YN57_9RHOB|nr:hypothetical protein GCM10010991_25250 [Gemmobacter aquaticus]